jgi:hypothetical protein
LIEAFLGVVANLINLNLWIPLVVFIFLSFAFLLAYLLIYKPIMEKFKHNELDHESFRKGLEGNEKEHDEILEKLEQKNNKIMDLIDKMATELANASKRRDEQFANIKVFMDKIAKDIFEYSLEKQSEIVKRKHAQYDIIKVFTMNSLDSTKRNIGKFIYTLENKTIDKKDIETTILKILSNSRQEINNQIEKQALPVSFLDASDKVYEMIAPTINTSVEEIIDMLTEISVSKERIKEMISKVAIIFERIKIIYVDLLRKIILNECD